MSRLSESLGFLPSKLEDCPNCGSGRTGIVLYTSMDDWKDRQRAAKRGYYVKHLFPNEEMEYDRFCLDCGFCWNHDDWKGKLTYQSERPKIHAERLSKLGWKLLKKWEKKQDADIET